MRLSNGKMFYVHGHRGSRGTHPENTFPAFDEALTAGADYIEIDVHLTRDRVPVVIHDPALSNRHYLDAGMPMDGPVPVCDLNASDLKRFDAGSIPNLEFPEQVRCPGQTIPTLEQVVRWLTTKETSCRLNIEIKCPPTASVREAPPAAIVARQIVEVLIQHQMERQSMVQSFDLSVLGQVQLLIPEGLRAALFESPCDYLKKTLAVGATFCSPHYSLVDKSLINKAHAIGLRVVPWTVNGVSDWARLLDLQVDGLITDYPRRLVQYLKERKLIGS